MKIKWVFWLVILVLLGYGASQRQSKAVTEKPPELNDQLWEGTAPLKEHTIQITKDRIYQGNLLLVNKDHPVPPGNVESEAVNLYQHQELLKGFGLLDHSIRLTTNLTHKFTAMVAAAKKDGVSHFLINSGYRDNKEQDELYRQMGPDYALPAGCSEHNLGLSLDIGSTLGEMDEAPEGRWLEQNAWKYGFILRYPADKTAITGIQYEPWHFRYVGLPHSAIMQEKDMVLEEYLAYLKQRKSITVTIDRQTYEITYYPVTGNTRIKVPANGRYEISGNNVDGVIVTVYS